MKLFMMLLFLGALVHCAALAQAPDPQWSIIHGGTGDDIMYSVQQTMDGGFIFAGVTTSAGPGVVDAWMIKTNSDGTILWEHTYGGSSPDAARSVEQTADGGYIFAGFTGAGLSSAVWLVKTDANGVMQWDRSFNSGGSSTDQGYAVAQTTDGGYIITGETRPNSQSWYDLWLVKTDANGNLQWEQTFGGSNHEGGRSVRQTADGGYVTLGYTDSFGAGREDFYLIKTSANGNVLWSRTYGGAEVDFPLSVQQTSDSGYVLAGYTNSFGAGGLDGWLIKTDGNGNQQWDRTYGGGGTEIVRSVHQTADGGYICTGQKQLTTANHIDLWMIKTDTGGNLQWENTLGGSRDDEGYAIRQTLDGGYVVAGATRSFGNGSGTLDGWLLKFGGEQLIAWRNPAGGVFSDSSNWVGGNAPDNTQTALFDSAYYGTAALNRSAQPQITITFDDIESTEGLTIADANIALDLLAHSYGVDHFTVGGIGGNIDSSSVLAIYNGVLGAAANDAPVTIGANNRIGRLTIGANGFVEVSAPAGATLPTLLVGDDNCSSPDSVCGAIVVLNGGTLFSAGVGLSNGVVNLRGTCSWEDTRRVTIAETGKGFLQALGGANFSSPELAIGLSTGSVGNAYFKYGFLNLEQLRVGVQGEGTLTLDSAALCQVFGPLTIGELNRGDVYLRDADMSVSGDLVIGELGRGELTIDSTAKVYCNNAIVGQDRGSVGRVLVSNRGTNISGDSTVWVLQEALFAGRFGEAVIYVEKQGRISVDNIFYLGEYDTGLCSTFVYGVGASIHVKGPLVAGLFGKGWMEIRDSAQVRVAGGATLGIFPNSVGDIFIGSAGQLEIGDSLLVGENGRGSVALQSGGTLNSLWAAVGGFTNAIGSARVDGAGSVWTNQGALHVGPQGIGLLRISDQGRLSNGGPLFVGPLGSFDATGGSFNSASLHVANGGTFIDSAGVLQLGTPVELQNTAAGGQVDSLFLAQGATFQVDSVAFLPGGFLGGSAVFQFDVVNSGGLNPGDTLNSAGVFSVNANYNQLTGGTLFIELGGLTPGTGHDQLVVTGTAQLSGTLDVSVINGFAPQVGQTFQVLTAGSMSGTFEQVTTAGGLGVAVTYNTSNVVITITSPVAIEPQVEDKVLPDRYSLEQNYPNPFNPSTVIRFGLPQGSKVLIELFNVHGQKVATVIDENLPAGIHDLQYDAGQLAGGVYFYRIQAGKFVQTRKMLLVK